MSSRQSDINVKRFSPYEEGGKVRGGHACCCSVVPPPSVCVRGRDGGRRPATRVKAAHGLKDAGEALLQFGC